MRDCQISAVLIPSGPLDAFWTAAETSFRGKAREYFRDGGPGPTSVALAVPSGLGLSGRVSIFEEAARHDPRLGRDLRAWPAASAAPSPDPLESRACGLARLAGTAAHVVEAGARAARERGSFSSSLMGCREIQESLAGLVSGAGLVHFAACRLCRLLEKGERERAGRESALLEAQARSLAADVRSVALSLLGESWVETNLPADDPPSDQERTPR
jgi:hypothetical protein